MRHEDTEGDPGAAALREIHDAHKRNLEECRNVGLCVADMEVEMQVKKYKARPETHAEKVAALVKGGITPANLWLIVGAAPINCDVVLEALDEMTRLEQEKLDVKVAEDAAAKVALDAKVAIVLEGNKDPSEWSGDELKTMLKSAMGGDGFSKYNTKPKMLEKYLDLMQTTTGSIN